MSAYNIIVLLGCLNITYFMFQDQFFKQTKAAVMGSPVSPIVANIYMDAFENRAISTALYPPRIWKRYVDDTFVIQYLSHKDDFFRHINLVEPSIQFTMEESKEDGSIPILDTIITSQPNGTFTTGVYRNPTYTYLYSPWDGYHNLSAMYSVINTLSHRVQTIFSPQQVLKNESQHLEKVLMLCKYTKWAINKIFHQQLEKKEGKKKKQTPPSKYSAKKCHIVVPYVQGICGSLKNMCGKHSVTVYFKRRQTLKNILVSPKDKDSMTKENSVSYSYSCGRIDCDEEYIGKSSRTFGERFEEHLKAPSPTYDHQSNSGPTTSIKNFQIIGREANNMDRAIKEAMYIRMNNPTLKRNTGKYNMPHIWGRALFSIPELNINNKK